MPKSGSRDGRGRLSTGGMPFKPAVLLVICVFICCRPDPFSDLIDSWGGGYTTCVGLAKRDVRSLVRMHKPAVRQRAKTQVGLARIRRTNYHTGDQSAGSIGRVADSAADGSCEARPREGSGRGHAQR